MTHHLKVRWEIVQSTEKGFYKIAQELANSVKKPTEIASTGSTVLYKTSLFNRELLIKKSTGILSGNERVIKDFHISWFLFKNGVKTPKPLGLIKVDITKALFRKSFFIFIRKWSNGIDLDNFLRKEGKKEGKVEEVIKNAIKLLAKIHSLNYIHTDFFPRNLLVKPDLSVEVFDFEHSKEEERFDVKIDEFIRFIESLRLFHNINLSEVSLKYLTETYFEELKL